MVGSQCRSNLLAGNVVEVAVEKTSEIWEVACYIQL